MYDICLWEILIPERNHFDGQKWTKFDHEEFDKYVETLCNGLTVMNPVKGKWLCPRGYGVYETMIPVRISTTTEIIKKIAQFAMQHYDQEVIMYYKLSNDVYLLSKKELNL